MFDDAVEALVAVVVPLFLTGIPVPLIALFLLESLSLFLSPVLGARDDGEDDDDEDFVFLPPDAVEAGAEPVVAVDAVVAAGASMIRGLSSSSSSISSSSSPSSSIFVFPLCDSFLRLAF